MPKRMPWKELVGAVLFIAVSLAFRLIPWSLMSGLDEKSIIRNTSVGLISLSGAVVLTAFLFRWRPTWIPGGYILLPRSLGRILRLAGFGLLIGGGMFGLVYLLTVWAGGLTDFSLAMDRNALLDLLSAVFLATVLNAAWEEYTFRGWPFLVAVRAIGPHPVAIGTGAIFGLLHTLNPHWTVLAVVSVSIAGWFLSYAMLAFRNIALVIGLHVGWNFVQSLLTSKRIWSYQANENPWLSGGEYGLEATAVGICVTAVAASIAFVVFLRSRNAAPVGDVLERVSKNR